MHSDSVTAQRSAPVTPDVLEANGFTKGYLDKDYFRSFGFRRLYCEVTKGVVTRTYLFNGILQWSRELSPLNTVAKLQTALEQMA